MTTEEDDEEGTRIIGVIKDYVRMDNTKKQLVHDTKDLSAPMKRMEDDITQYMTKRMIFKISTNRTGSEHLELKSKARLKKPTKELMIHRMKKLMQSQDLLDKTAEQIVVHLMEPASNEQVITLCRKCRKKGSGAKSKKIEEGEAECCKIESIRELVDEVKQPGTKRLKSQPEPLV